MAKTRQYRRTKKRKSRKQRRRRGGDVKQFDIMYPDKSLLTQDI